VTGTHRQNRIRRWLTRTPQPHTCIGENVDGSERKVKLTQGRYRFSDATKALMEAVRIIAVDEDGSELRTLELGKEDEAEAEAEEQERSQRLSEVNQFREILAHEVPALVDKIASRIESATKAAFEAGAASYRGAFDSLLGVVKAQGTVATASMKDQMTLLRTLQAQQLANAPEAPAGDGEAQQLDQIMMQLLSGGGAAPGAPAAAPNGNGGGLGGLDPRMLQQLMALLMQQQKPAPPAPAPPVPPSNGGS